MIISSHSLAPACCLATCVTSFSTAVEARSRSAGLEHSATHSALCHHIDSNFTVRIKLYSARLSCPDKKRPTCLLVQSTIPKMSPYWDSYSTSPSIETFSVVVHGRAVGELCLCNYYDTKRQNSGNTVTIMTAYNKCVWFANRTSSTTLTSSSTGCSGRRLFRI